MNISGVLAKVTLRSALGHWSDVVRSIPLGREWIRRVPSPTQKIAVQFFVLVYESETYVTRAILPFKSCSCNAKGECLSVDIGNESLSQN